MKFYYDKFILILSISLILSILGCGPQDTNDIKSKQAETINILHFPGEDVSTDGFIALPFAIGTYKGYPTVLLAKDLEEGSKVSPYIIGGFETKVNDSLLVHFLTVPRDTSLRCLDATNFMEFTTKYSDVMWIVEYYITHYRKDVAWVRWLDEVAVKKKLVK